MSVKSSEKLVRKIGLMDAIAISIGCIIGSGIFRVPSSVAGQLSSPYLMLWVWVFGGLLSLAGALCYAELAAAFPKTGGDYVYVTEAYGPAVGFIFGWTRLFVERTGTLAAISMVFAEYALYFMSLPRSAMPYLAAATVVALTLINMIGIHWGKRIQNLFTALKILALLAIVGIGLFMHRGTLSNFQNVQTVPLSLGDWQSMGLALIFVLFTYGGWMESCYVAGEIKDPQRNLPRAIIFGLLVTMIIYLSANAIYLYYVPAPELKTSSLAAATMMERALGSIGGKLVALMVLVSTFGALNGYVLTGGRLLFAISEDHHLFKKLAHVHPKFHTPWIALSFNALIALIMIFTGTFDQILSFMTVAVWSLYLLVGLSVFKLRKKHPHIDRPYRIWGYPWVPIIFLVSTFLFVANVFLKNTQQAVLGFLVALLGLPFYALSRQIK